MPRKSTGAVSTSASSAGTSVSKPSGPRKSISTVDDAESGPSSALIIDASTKVVLKQQETALKSSGIESYELPRTQVIKVAKSDIPDTVQLRKEVQQALVKSASVFISYLTATAHDRATKKGGKIISAQHVLEAWNELQVGDEGSVKVLKEQLGEYRRMAQRKKDANKAKTKDADGNEGDVSRATGHGEDDQDGEEGDETRAGNDDEDEGGDGSMLKRTLQNGHGGADEDEEGEEDEQGEDQLMDED